MTLADFYTRVNYALRGIDEDQPVHSSDEAVFWLSTLNRKKDEVYEDVTKNWRNTFYTSAPTEPGTVATTGTTTLTGTSTYFTDYAVGDKITVSGETERTIATISSDTVLTVTVAFSNTASSLTFTRKTIIATGVQTYSLHRSFINLSGDDSVANGESSGVYVISTDDQRSNLPVIQPDQQNPSVAQVYLSGLTPQTLTFTKEIEATDSIVGGQLFTPAYYMPADVVDETDVLPFLDPNYAVMAVASEVAFSDITYEDKAPDLNAKANDLYKKMVQKNRSQLHNNPQPLKYNVKRIGNSRYS